MEWLEMMIGATEGSEHNGVAWRSRQAQTPILFNARLTRAIQISLEELQQPEEKGRLTPGFRRDSDRLLRVTLRESASGCAPLQSSWRESSKREVIKSWYAGECAFTSDKCRPIGNRRCCDPSVVFTESS